MSNTPTEAQREEARRRFLALHVDSKAAAQHELQDWLRRDPAHMTAWAEVESIWEETASPGQRLAKLEAAELSVYLRVMDRRQKRTRVLRNGVLGLVLMLGFGLAGGLWLKRPHFWQDLAADHLTRRGERQEITLADGSRVLLDADSALKVDITADTRLIELSRGAASFRVTKSSVPFRVRFGEGEITVHGTVFDIWLLEDGGLVTLQEGSVAVSYPGMNGPQMLRPGEQFSAGRTPSGASAAPTISQVEITDASGWREGRMVFEMMRFGDLISALERHSSGRFIISESALADRLVSGSLDLDRPDLALQSLRDTIGFSVTHLPGPFILLRP